MSDIPREASFDSTFSLLSEGYTFVSSRAARHGSDVFRARVMLRDAVFMVGEEAARQFYEPGRLTRRGALPRPVLALLQDKGSVQLLDGPAHHHRKAMFLSLLSEDRLDRLAAAMSEVWLDRLRSAWVHAGTVVLLDEVREILCDVVCQWVGIPRSGGEVRERTRELSAMVDGAGAVGPRSWWAHLLRRRTERWARGIIRDIRTGVIDVPDDAPARVIAMHHDDQGRLLDARVAAVELINVLRPTVAVGNYVVLAALALHEHPECVPALRRRDDHVQAFVHEVRRFYPFFPVIGGRVREPFDWRGHHFARGSWLLLDLFGTNHDPRSWTDPLTFDPARFHSAQTTAFTLIPQGGGDHETGHRCAGEWLTIRLMETAVTLLTKEMRYDVPTQDLAMASNRMPAIPPSRFVMTSVRPAPSR